MLQIIYYDPFLFMKDGIVNQSIYGIDELKYFKELEEKGCMIFCYSMLMDKSAYVLGDTHFSHIGLVDTEHPFGDGFEEIVRDIPFDVLISKYRISEDLVSGKLNYLVEKHDPNFVFPKLWQGIGEELPSYEILSNLFSQLSSDKQKLYDYFVYTSDYYAAQLINEKYNLGRDDDDWYECVGYDWMDTEILNDDRTEEFLKDKNFHDIGNFKKQEGTLARLKTLDNVIKKLPDGSIVLDYGCQVGQFTLYFANKYPKLYFTGVDISGASIDFGLKKIESFDLPNLELKRISRPSDLEWKYDMVYACEILEHLWNYDLFLKELEERVKIGGTLFLSTPYGAFESKTFYKLRKKERSHFHNFEEVDFANILNGRDSFSMYDRNPPTPFGEKNGHYSRWWTVSKYMDFGKVDYERKCTIQNPNLKHLEMKNFFESQIKLQTPINKGNPA